MLTISFASGACLSDCIFFSDLTVMFVVVIPMILAMILIWEDCKNG